MTAALALARRVLAWLVPALPRARVAWVRTALAVMAVLDVRYFLNSTGERGGTPELFAPVLVAEWLHLPPVTDGVAQMLFVGVHVGAVAMVLGGFARVPAAVQHAGGLVLGVSYLLWVLWAMSYGYVSHDHMAIVIGMLVLPTAGTSRYGGGPTADSVAGWPLRMIQLFTVLTYLGSVLAKYVFSGGSLLRWATSGTLAWAFIRRPNDVNQLLVQHALLLRAAQWGALLLEIASPVVFALRGRWLALAIGAFMSFHLATFVLLGIHFLPTVVCWSAFVPWERLPAWWRARRRTASLAPA
ncbi:hypothetical protein IM660_16885 [Ruania alkalisoli]|uniref:HTTM domain-containing protein n=1 Tax=Ruania alkalisoli TaxID=2779775 RepID=A0A7M1SRR4_9MICO|nr:hypothetical protein [Ruania alkalisoli]QOR70259.1 hypothetical protein IM660_16885 [Ruania alkalisoli]